jgi:hypothetical protein
LYQLPRHRWQRFHAGQAQSYFDDGLCAVLKLPHHDSLDADFVQPCRRDGSDQLHDVPQRHFRNRSPDYTRDGPDDSQYLR